MNRTDRVLRNPDISCASDIPTRLTFPARRSIARIRVRPKGGVGAAVRAWAAPEMMYAQTQAIGRGVQLRERLSAG